MAIFNGFGPYRTIRRIGKGGMGDVYLAEDTRRPQGDPGRFIALKVMWHGVERDAPGMLEAERQGAQLQSRLYGVDNRIARVNEYGDIEDSFYIDMEYIDGRDLTELIRRGPVASIEATRIAIEICDILDRVHTTRFEHDHHDSRGVVHGDIKPRNIRIDRMGRVRLLDFGIAKALSMTRRLTRNEFGSLGYSSPERLDTGEVNEHSDLWAVAVVLYEMLTGRPPFDADSTRRIEQAILSRVSPPDPDLPIPAPLKRLLVKALAPDLELRYLSALHFKNALQDAYDKIRFELDTCLEPSPDATRRTLRPQDGSPVQAEAPVRSELEPSGPVQAEAPVRSELEPSGPVQAEAAVRSELEPSGPVQAEAAVRSELEPSGSEQVRHPDATQRTAPAASLSASSLEPDGALQGSGTCAQARDSEDAVATRRSSQLSELARHGRRAAETADATRRSSHEAAGGTSRRSLEASEGRDWRAAGAPAGSEGLDSALSTLAEVAPDGPEGGEASDSGRLALVEVVPDRRQAGPGSRLLSGAHLRKAGRVLRLAAGFALFGGLAVVALNTWYVGRDVPGLLQEINGKGMHCEAAWDAYQDLVDRSILGYTPERLELAIVRCCTDEAEQVIKRFRTDDPKVVLSDWKRANRAVRHVLALKYNRKMDTWEAYTRAQVLRIEEQFDAARAAYDKAAELDPTSCDPFLALWQMYAYKVPDLDALEAARAQLLERGCEPGKRQEIQRADAQHFEANRLFALDLEERPVEERRENLEKVWDLLAAARETYMRYPTFGAAKEHLRRVERRLADVDRKLEALLSPPEPTPYPGPAPVIRWPWWTR